MELIKAKVLEDDELDRVLNRWRFKDDKIVFANGCFDILHVGHITLLAKAKDMGDRLIVGLNSDESVRRLKGENRPIYNEETRALILSALHFVDAVYVFNEETPEKLIQRIRPDFLVKGGDWKEDEIVGAKFVKQYGGQVKIIDLVEGISTSIVEAQIKQFV